MNLLSRRLLAFLICILPFQLSSAQNQYELLYLEHNYDQIIAETTNINDSVEVFWHVLALDKNGESLAALNFLESNISNFEVNESLELQLLDLLYKTGQNAKAKPLLLKYHKNPDVFMKLIRTLELESDNSTAIKYLEERLETDSTNIEYLARLGDNYNEVERELSARESYIKVVMLNPNDVIVLGKLANLQLKIPDYERYDMAIYYCNLALLIDSTNRSIIKIKGIAAFRKGDFEMAEENFDYLFEKGDSSISTLKHLGISEYKNEYHEDSYNHLMLAYKQDTSDHEVCYFLGRDLIYNRAPEEALYYLKLADTLIHPKPAIQVAIIVEMASAYTDMYENEKAIELYSKAYSIKPRADYLFFMASLYQNRLKDYHKALEYYQWFLEELPPPKKTYATIQRQAQSISLKRTAERNIVKLKEELFLRGELSTDTIVNN